MIRYLGRTASGTRGLVVPVGRLPDVMVEHPERTTLRNAGDWDVELREWPSAGAMLTAYRMARSGTNPRNLRPYRPEDRRL